MPSASFDWPEPEGLLAFVRKYGAPEAARRLGCAVGTLRFHLNSIGYTAADYQKTRPLNDDALKEIADLIA
jgi:hypothetical protein